MLTVNVPETSDMVNVPIVTEPGPTYTSRQRLAGDPKSCTLSATGIIWVAICGK